MIKAEARDAVKHKETVFESPLHLLCDSKAFGCANAGVIDELFELSLCRPWNG